MKKFNFITVPSFLIALIFLLSGCQVIGDIFKAGVWAGVLGVVIIIVLIFWLISKRRNK
ncbi:MAG TPA: hypothetical protein VG847_02725 [Chitinophagaceae bacterium]|nr:hypothetical protein [Chitinophagaceae bacterium]